MTPFSVLRITLWRFVGQTWFTILKTFGLRKEYLLLVNHLFVPGMSQTEVVSQIVLIDRLQKKRISSQLIDLPNLAQTHLFADPSFLWESTKVVGAGQQNMTIGSRTNDENIKI